MILPPVDSFKFFKSIPGALSVCECIAIANVAAQAPPGIYLELGTHKGKSAYAAVYSLQPGAFNLVDPIFEDKELAQKVQYIVANATSKMIFCPTLAETSLEAIPKFQELSYVFLDSGDHGEELVRAEIELLEDRIIPGGILAFHDYGNQFTAVARAYDYLVSTDKYEPIPIDWVEIFNYVRENNLEEGNISWHEKGSEEFPKFVGALKRK